MGGGRKSTRHAASRSRYDKKTQQSNLISYLSRSTRGGGGGGTIFVRSTCPVVRLTSTPKRVSSAEDRHAGRPGAHAPKHSPRLETTAALLKKHVGWATGAGNERWRRCCRPCFWACGRRYLQEKSHHGSDRGRHSTLRFLCKEPLHRPFYRPKTGALRHWLAARSRRHGGA